MIKGHGSDIHDYKDIIADFSSNVSYIDYSNILKDIICNDISSLKTYPDVEYISLRKLLAAKHDCNANNIIITNGAVAGIYQIAQTFANKNTSLFYPEFAEYESACNLFNHNITFLKNGDFSELQSDCDFTIIGNPNNPTGALIERKDLSNLFENNPSTVFAIDEAYMEFVSKSQSVISLIKQYSNIIIIKSFTKRYTIPGLRLGYIVANNDLIDRINKFSQPWSVNSLAAKVGQEILLNNNKFAFDIDILFKEKQRVYNQLNSIGELQIYNSHSNYYLIKLKNSSAKKLKAIFAEKHHILIRNASNFRGLNDSYIRISIRGKDDNDILINAFYDYFNKQ